MRVGWLLWCSLAKYERDYFSCAPGADQVCLHREISYIEYVGRLRSLASTLPADGESTLGGELAMAITPHSFRSFLPTALDAIGAPATELDQMALSVEALR